MEAFPPSLDLRGTTLVLPVVAVGNVGQLAADLLVSTLRLPRSGRLADDALLPAVGGAAYPHAPGLASALEVYRAPGDGVAVAQQRSAAVPGTQVPYARRLAAFLKAAGVEQVLVLGSIEAGFRRDAQLAGPQLRWWAPADAGSSALMQRCQDAVGLLQLEASFFDDRPLDARQLQPWPVLRELASAGVSCAALLSFSAEGDNVAEAFGMATAAAVVAGLQAPAATGGEGTAAPQQWVPPPSWQHVYGSAPAVY